MGKFTPGTIAGRVAELRKLGAREGGLSRPSQDSTAPDSNESEVISIAQSYVAAETTAYSDALAIATKRLADAELETETISADCRSAESTDLIESVFGSTLAKHQYKLIDKSAAELKSRAALQAFRYRNSIEDAARYPEDKLLHFAWLIVFVAIETAVNAFFYEGAAGLLGGAVVAFGVAAVNMGIALLFGIWFRYSHLPGLKNKLAGYSSLACFVLLAVAMNLIFSTFRVQYGLVEDTANWLAVRQAFILAVKEAFGVFALQLPGIDFNSFILFFIGLGCSGIAFYKGYTIDDRYPGHGEADREHKVAALDLDSARELLRLDVQNELGRRIAQIEALKSRVIAHPREIFAIKVQAQHAQSGYVATTKIIQSELNLAIDAYRGSNRATATVRRPDYFDKPIDLLTGIDYVSELELLLKRIEDASGKAKALADTYTQQIGERVLASHKASQSLLANEFNKHLEEIDRAAQAKIAAAILPVHQRAST